MIQPQLLEVEDEPIVDGSTSEGPLSKHLPISAGPEQEVAEGLLQG